MRTNEERITALHSRVVKYRRYRRIRNTGICISLMMCVLETLLIPCVDIGDIEMVSNGMVASIFNDASSLYLVLIAVLAFLLGVSVTIFCFYLKKWYERID
ncbi:MAG: hypothetical protein IKS54_02665 [Erysipelotrichaceae bacterium]|nr:hypothetical protein [Erysipelotrichaceae bacterium]